MPARDFRLFLYNDTPWRLQRAGVDLHQGSWTAPWEPPEFIEAGGHGSWQSESDGLYEGTEGSISYVIRDSSSYIAGDHFGHGDAVHVSWYNPFLGAAQTSFACRFHVTGQVPGAAGEFGGEGSLDSETALDYRLDKIGPTTQGDPQGPIITEGWVEVVPGLLALPVPTAIIEHAQGAVRLRYTPHASKAGTQQQEFNPAIGPASPHSLEPVVDAPADGWIGTWTQGSDDLTVTIAGAPDGRFAVTVIDGNPPSVHLKEDSVELSKERPDANPQFPTRHEHPIADSGEQGRFPTHRRGAPLVPHASLGEHVLGRGKGERAFQPTSDSINLAAGVRLELNGSYDGNHGLDGYRLHYRRVADGSVVTDAMLAKRVHIA